MLGLNLIPTSLGVHCNLMLNMKLTHFCVESCAKKCVTLSTKVPYLTDLCDSIVAICTKLSKHHTLANNETILMQVNYYTVFYLI